MDTQARLLFSEMQIDLNMTGLGVLLDVRKTLLSHTVERQKRHIRKLFLAAGHFEINCQSGLAQLFYQNRNSLDAGKYLLFGPQCTDRAAHILQGLFHHPLRITDSLESFLRLFRSEEHTSELQSHSDL